MASACRPSCPSSLQIRFGLRCRESPPVLLGVRFRPLDRRFGLVFAAGEAAGGERRGEPWRCSNGSPDSFAGWSAVENGGGKPPEEETFGGVLGAVLAGLLFAAGVAFATLSLTSKSGSGAKQEMQPLSTEQERLINSDTNENLGQDFILPSTINEEASKSISDVEHHMEASLIHNTKSADVGSDATERASDQGDLEMVEDIDKISGPAGFSTSTPELDAHIIDFSPDRSNLKDLVGTTYSETQESVTGDLGITIAHDDLIHLDTVSTNHITNYHDGNTKPAETSNSEVQLDLLVGSDSQVKTDSVDNLDTQTKDVVLNPVSIQEDQGFAQNDMQFPTEVSTSDPPSCDTLESGPLETSMSLDFDQIEQLMLQPDSISFPDEHKLSETGSSVAHFVSTSADPNLKEPDTEFDGQINRSPLSEPQLLNKALSHSGIPAPCHISATQQLSPGKVLVPALVDQVQGQALAALQVLKVIEADVQPGDICTRREYARWLVTASSNLSRKTVSKIYPAMYIDNVTELAFDDVMPEDPDFPCIQGLAEAGLISSKLSRTDLGNTVNDQQDYILFSPESPVSRQDLISWKMATERRQLPEVDINDIYQCCGYIDIHRINPDAWPALVADLSSGGQSITALAFGCTRLFQPDKPITKAQAAIALATGDAAEIVSEELARIEAESLAETAVSADAALLAQVEKDVNANFEKELTKEREKAKALEKLAEEAKLELDRLRAEREEEHNALIKGHAVVESEMEVLSRLRHEVEEQLQSLMSNQLEISFEKDRINKLRKEAESQNQVIAQLQSELEVERKALFMARSWAEEEAKRAREQAKALEEAKERWEGHGTVVVDADLVHDADVGTAVEQPQVDETIQRGESLVEKLKTMAAELRIRSAAVIEKIILKIITLIAALKQQASAASDHTTKLWENVFSKAKSTVDVFHESASGFGSVAADKARRIVEDCKEGVEKITHKFKT
ncbi:s-layer protein [Musa troglodytarum]|nr:s-layer protein [Musa troglodytarum]